MNRDMWLEKAIAQWEVPLLRTCYLLLGDAALCEDAVQETFIRAWKGYDGFRGESSEKTWLMRIAVNVCRDLRRSRWFRHVDRRVRMEDLPEAVQSFDPPDDTLVRAVLALPQKLRQVVILRYFQGLAVQEVAQVSGISRRTVHDRLKRAEGLLRDSLKEWYDVE